MYTKLPQTGKRLIIPQKTGQETSKHRERNAHFFSNN